MNCTWSCVSGRYYCCSIVTVRNSSCGKGYVFTSVCHSVHRRECTPSLGRHPLARLPRADTPPGRHPHETATAADGTHPTGMHSCFTLYAGKIWLHLVMYVRQAATATESERFTTSRLFSVLVKYSWGPELSGRISKCVLNHHCNSCMLWWKFCGIP